RVHGHHRAQHASDHREAPENPGHAPASMRHFRRVSLSDLRSKSTFIGPTTTTVIDGNHQNPTTSNDPCHLRPRDGFPESRPRRRNRFFSPVPTDWPEFEGR